MISGAPVRQGLAARVRPAKAKLPESMERVQAAAEVMVLPGSPLPDPEHGLQVLQQHVSRLQHFEDLLRQTKRSPATAAGSLYITSPDIVSPCTAEPFKVVPFTSRADPLTAPPSHKLVRTLKCALAARDPLMRSPLSVGPRPAWEGTTELLLNSPFTRANYATKVVKVTEAADTPYSPLETTCAAKLASCDDNDHAQDEEIEHMIVELGFASGPSFRTRLSFSNACTAQQVQPMVGQTSDVCASSTSVVGDHDTDNETEELDVVVDGFDEQEGMGSAVLSHYLFPATDEQAQPSSVRLHTVAARGDVAIILQLLQQDCFVDMADSGGRSALMYAVHFEQLDSVKTLMANKAAIDHQAHDGTTALHYAAFAGSSAMFTTLLKYQASFLLPDLEGRTAIHWATHNRSTAPLQELLKTDNYGNLNAKDGAGMTPAMWAAFYDQPRHLCLLRKHGADLLVQDVNGRTALHWAATTYNLRCLKQLLTHNSSSWTDQLGRTVAHTAAEAGSSKALKQILKLRPSAVEDKDSNGRTPLHWAAVQGHAIALRTLLRQGADPLVIDLHGLTSYDYAYQKGNRQCCVLLYTACSTSDTLPPPETCAQPLVSDCLDTAHRLFDQLATGSWLAKYTDNGLGWLHDRFFWLDRNSAHLHWGKNPGQTTHTAAILDVIPGPHEIICRREDFNPVVTHLFSFTLVLQAPSQPYLHLIAKSQTEHELWISGIRHLQAYSGLVHAIQRQRDAVAARQEFESK